jgi:hypothetical protein
MNSSLDNTVFYAWQSDRNQDHCRYFIRDAAKRALKIIASDVQVKEAPSLDHDTKGEPGTPHIAKTIQRKIRRCKIFLADLTAVTRYAAGDGRQKDTPNPNILIELGLAIHHVGYARILLVMNTAYGGPEDLPFDLKHHSWPITYSLKDGDDSKPQQEWLCKVFGGKTKGNDCERCH